MASSEQDKGTTSLNTTYDYTVTITCFTFPEILDQIEGYFQIKGSFRRKSYFRSKSYFQSEGYFERNFTFVSQQGYQNNPFSNFLAQEEFFKYIFTERLPNSPCY